MNNDNSVVTIDARWKIVEEENNYDTYGRRIRHAECSLCGFIWADLYSVKNYFKCCPNCGKSLKWEEASADARSTRSCPGACETLE